MMSKLGEFLTISATIAAISAWQEQLEWSLRVAAAVIAVVAGLAALMDRRRGRRKVRGGD